MVTKAPQSSGFDSNSRRTGLVGRAFPPAMGEPDRAPVLDLAHLAQQTLGDEELARDLLVLFTHQCERLLPVITGSGSVGSRRDACHTLKGAARAVGAGEMARILEEAERACGTPADGAALAAGLEQAAAAFRAASARHLFERG